MLVLAGAAASAQVCAPPGSLLTGPSTGVVNNYYAGNGNLSVGATSIPLGTLRGSPGLSTAVAVGDLLLVIQMQDASFAQANDSTYGNGSGTGAGTTSVGRTGLYEFVRVTSAGATVGITPPLANSYVQANATASTAQRRYQVLRVPQYSSLTATGITAPAWDGSTGGVTAVDVQNTLTLGSGAVETQAGVAFFLAGKGFRGGAGRGLTSGTTANTDFMRLASSGGSGSKGEGIAGTPYFTATQTNGWMAKTSGTPAITIPAGAPGIEGYPSGSYAAGAPGNAGGGGVDGDPAGTINQNNAGGGGGGNYAKGGHGGRPWNFPLVDSGGRGGAGYAGTLDFNRVFLGGGGGAGGTNNSSNDAASYTNNGIGCALGAACSSGAAGGGIVIIRAKSVSGSGTIDVRGAHGYNVGQDAGGGGGAGGSVIIQTINGGNATVVASGGDGGNAWAGNAGGTGGRHGPGGAGGGGFVAFSPSSLSVTANVDGGAPGRTMNNLVPEDSYGSTGFNGGMTSFLVPNVPGVPPAAACDANLSLAKTDGVTVLVSPSSNTYTFTVTNSGNAASSGTVTVADKLPAGLSVTPGTLTVSGPNAAAWACSAANTTDIYCLSQASIAGSGGTSSFALATAVSSANGTAVTNRGRVAGGGDPAKTLPASPAAGVTDAAACTANNNPAGCALDTDTVSAPNLSLTKTDNVTGVSIGGTSTYVLTVSNLGGAATTGTTTVVDVLPAGLQFNSTAAFTANSFSCTIAGQVLTCNRTAALAANATATVTFTVTALSTAGSSVVNKAQVGGGGDPSPLKSGIPTAATAAACPAPVEPATTSSDSSTGCAADINEVRYVRLELSKDDGQVFVSSSGTAAYAFTVSNVGNITSTGVISMRDALTGTMTVTAAITPGGANGSDWACTIVPTRYFNCTSSVAIPAGGSSVFTVNVSVGAAAAGVQQKNLARVGGGGDIRSGMVTTPGDADVTACISNGNPLGCAIDLNTVQNAPEVRVSKSHPDPQARSPGSTVTFTLVLRNNGGTNAATNTVTLVDVLPAGLTISGTPVAASPFTCTVSGQVVTCVNSGGVFAAGTTRSVVINAVVAASATNSLVNRARVGATGDPQNSTLPTSANTVTCAGNEVPSYGCATDPVPLNADLSVLKQQRTGTGSFQTALLGIPVGSTLQYSITVGNSGPGNVTSVTIADTVPTNFSTVTWTCSTNGTATCGTASGSGNEISLLGNINSGATITVLVTAVAASATPIGGVTNTAQITVPAGINDATPGNNSSSVPTAVGVTNLSITKNDGVTSIGAGASVTYTLVASNTGPTPANGARIYDPASTGLVCTAAPVCTASAGATCPAGLTIAQLQNATAPTGVAIPVFGAGSSVTITVTCGVTATGQ